MNKPIYFLADINEKLRLDEITGQFNRWAAQVEKDFKEFEQKLTIEEITKEMIRTRDELTAHFANMGTELEKWDMQNREVV